MIGEEKIVKALHSSILEFCLKNQLDDIINRE
jgi:hypothetical protein